MPAKTRDIKKLGRNVVTSFYPCYCVSNLSDYFNL